jgi:hypothetical protein
MSPEVKNELERLHEEFALVTADKACNNIVFVCKALAITTASLMNLLLILLLATPLTPQLLSQKMKFFKIIGPF